MPHVEITGDSGSAVAAVAAAQAAIDSLHGKTVEIGINTSGGGSGGIASAGRDLDNFGRAADRASDGAERLAISNGHASSGARSMADDHEQASSALRNMGNEASRVGRTFDDMWRDSPGPPPDWATGLEDGSRAAAAPMRDLNSELSSSERFMVGAGGGAERVGNALVPLGHAASSGAIELKDFGDGIYRASGAASDGTRTISAFGRLLGDVGEEGGGSSGGGFLSRLTSGLSGMGKAASGAMDDMEAGLSPGKMMGSLQGIGMAALYATAGIGLLDAGVGALGAGAAVASLHDIPGAMNAVRDAGHSFDQGMKSVAQSAGGEVAPALAALKTPARELGKEFAQLGVDNMANTAGDLTKLAGTATETMKALAPAVKPAEDAFTTLADSAMVGLGRAEPALEAFSNSISQNAPGLTNLASGLTRDMSTAGQFVVNTAAAAGNAFPTGVLSDDGPSQAWGVGQMIGSAIPALKTLSDNVDAAVAPYLPSSVQTALGMKAPDAVQSATNYGGISQSEMDKMPQGTLASGASSPLLPMNPQSQPLTPNEQTPIFGPKSPTDGTALGPTDQTSTKPIQAPRQVGSSLPADSPQTANQLAQAMRNVQQAGQQAGQSTQQFGAQTRTGMQQAAQGAQQGAQGVLQPLRQMPQQAQNAMQGVQPAVQQPLQSAMRQAGQSAAPAAAQAGGAVGAQVGASAGQHVTRSETDTMDTVRKWISKVTDGGMPQADAGGQAMGGAVTSGTGKGITQTETDVLTIVKNWITKVIDTGAAGLDAHSPSRVFARLGESIPQGLAVGVQSAAPQSVAATNNLMQQVTQGATSQLSSTQNQLQNQLSQALTPKPITGQQQQNLPQNQQNLAQQQQQRLDNSPYRRQLDDQKTLQEKAQKDMADLQSRGLAGKPGWDINKDADERARLQKMGYSPQTQQRVLDQMQKHDTEAYQRREDRATRHDSALYQSRYGTLDPAYFQKNESRQDAQARMWREDHPGQGWSQPYADRANQSAAGLQAQKAGQEAQNRARLGIGKGAGNPLFQSGQESGQSLDQGMADGIDKDANKPQDAAGKMTNGVIDKTKKNAGVASPSTITDQVGRDVAAGLGQGVSNGITKATNAVTGIANDRGLMVGYNYARGVESGIDSVFKTSDFQAATVPQIDSEAATTALGQLGLLGTSGGGGEVSKNPSVTLTGGNTQLVAPITIPIYLDGQLLTTTMQNQLVDAVNQIANAYATN